LIRADLHSIAANQHYLQRTRVFSTAFVDSQSQIAQRVHPVV
jgi:hypothetical protein